MIGKATRWVTVLTMISLLSSSAFCQEEKTATRHFGWGSLGSRTTFRSKRWSTHESSLARTPTSSPTTSRVCRGQNCLRDKPFSDELISEWKGKKEATPKGGKVYLAISPGRGDLKPGEKSLPFPKELVGKSYDDPVVMKAYLSYCRRMIEFFQPDYLGIGIEVNEIYQVGPDKWRAYAALHRHVYQELKKDHPNLPIFASFTLHGMLNQTRSQARGDAHGVQRNHALRAISSPSAFTRSSGAARRTSTAACGGSPITSMGTRSRMRSWKSGSPLSGCESLPAVRSSTARRRSRRRSTRPCWRSPETTRCGS